MVFPTSVGMNRQEDPHSQIVSSVPHKRGDEPVKEYLFDWRKKCSPQAWG